MFDNNVVQQYISSFEWYENNEKYFTILIVISIIWTEDLKGFLNWHNVFTCNILLIRCHAPTHIPLTIHCICMHSRVNTSTHWTGVTDQHMKQFSSYWYLTYMHYVTGCPKCDDWNTHNFVMWHM
jgi:hypothetical protein